jgi:radical SAM-linked protein
MAKVEEARWLSHLELIAAFYRALRRAALPLAFSGGHHPLPRVSFHGALPVGLESLGETLDLELTQACPAADLTAALNQVLPAGLKIIQAQRLPRQAKPPQPALQVYEVAAAQTLFKTEAAARFLEQAEVLVTRERPKQAKIIDLRRLVASLKVFDPCHLELTVKVFPQDNLKIPEMLAAIFALPDHHTAGLHILKRHTSYHSD